VRRFPVALRGGSRHGNFTLGGRARLGFSPAPARRAGAHARQLAGDRGDAYAVDPFAAARSGMQGEQFQLAGGDPAGSPSPLKRGVPTRSSATAFEVEAAAPAGMNAR
jgi:hypothetical protein